LTLIFDPSKREEPWPRSCKENQWDRYAASKGQRELEISGCFVRTNAPCLGGWVGACCRARPRNPRRATGIATMSVVIVLVRWDPTQRLTIHRILHATPANDAAEWWSSDHSAASFGGPSRPLATLRSGCRTTAFALRDAEEWSEDHSGAQILNQIPTYVP